MLIAISTSISNIKVISIGVLLSLLFSLAYY